MRLNPQSIVNILKTNRIAAIEDVKTFLIKHKVLFKQEGLPGYTSGERFRYLTENDVAMKFFFDDIYAIAIALEPEEFETVVINICMIHSYVLRNDPNAFLRESNTLAKYFANMLKKDIKGVITQQIDLTDAEEQFLSTQVKWKTFATMAKQTGQTLNVLLSADQKQSIREQMPVIYKDMHSVNIPIIRTLIREVICPHYARIEGISLKRLVDSMTNCLEFNFAIKFEESHPCVIQELIRTEFITNEAVQKLIVAEDAMSLNLNNATDLTKPEKIQSALQMLAKTIEEDPKHASILDMIDAIKENLEGFKTGKLMSRQMTDVKIYVQSQEFKKALKKLDRASLVKLKDAIPNDLKSSSECIVDFFRKLWHSIVEALRWLKPKQTDNRDGLFSNKIELRASFSGLQVEPKRYDTFKLA